MKNTENKQTITRGQYDLLTREFGKYFQQIIELEFGITVKEFCDTYLEWDDCIREWVCNI